MINTSESSRVVIVKQSQERQEKEKDHKDEKHISLLPELRSKRDIRLEPFI